MGIRGISCFLKLFFGTLAVVGFLLVLLVGSSLESTQGGTTRTAATLTPEFAGSANHVRHADAGVVGTEKLLHPELDFNYMSKRRVPNGPDPIHNRRAGNSGRPPGQA